LSKEQTDFLENFLIQLHETVEDYVKNVGHEITGKSFENFVRSSLYDRGYRLLNWSLGDDYYDYVAGREFKFDALVEVGRDFLILVEAKDHRTFDSVIDLFYFIAESDIWVAYKRVKEENRQLAVSRFIAVSGVVTRRILKAGLTYGIGFIFPGCNPSAYFHQCHAFANISRLYLFYGKAKPLSSNLVERIVNAVQ